jgi:hypothetical protein
MRRLAPALTLFVAACASTPKEVPRPVAAAPRPPQTGDLIGLTAPELQARLGAPMFQVREGPGLKLQFASASCVLDAYLYPPAGSNSGTQRVTHVEARTRAGLDTNRAGCVATLIRPPQPAAAAPAPTPPTR